LLMWWSDPSQRWSCWSRRKFYKCHRKSARIS